MKMISFSFFILTVWIIVLTFSYCKLKDSYNESTAEVEQLHETIQLCAELGIVIEPIK